MHLTRSLRYARSILWNSYLSGTIPDLSNLTSLTALCVRACGVICSHAWLRQLTCALHYTRSDLYTNSLSGTIPASLGSLTSLTMLCVRADATPGCGS